jgi:hypothetical protein
MEDRHDQTYLNSSTCILCVNRPRIGRRVGGKFTFCTFPTNCEKCGKFTKLVNTKTFKLSLTEHMKYCEQINARNRSRDLPVYYSREEQIEIFRHTGEWILESNWNLK